MTTASSVPPLFSQCSDEYQPGKDEKYVQNCTFETESDACALLHVLHKTITLRHFVLGYVPIGISILALAVNIVYVTAIIGAFRRGGVVSRKRYSFLLNRSFSDIFAVCLYYFIVIVWQVHEFTFSYALTALFILIGGVSFLVLTGTYVAMTSLLYIAITRPLIYHQMITMRRCYYIIGAIWLVSLVLAAICGPFGATLFFPDSAGIHCPYYECQRPLVFFVVLLMCTCYGLVLLFYMVMLVKMRSMKMIRTNSQRGNVVVMNRLGMNIGIFAITSVPMATVCIIALSQLKTFTSLGMGNGKCKYFVDADLFYKLELLAGCGAILWVLRMLIDPLINGFNDPKFRNFILRRRSVVASSVKAPPAPTEPVVLSPIGKDE